jgi:hypothetical protein
MGRKRHAAGEIVAKLRQVDVLMAQGRPEAVRAIGKIQRKASAVTHHETRIADVPGFGRPILAPD